MEQFFIRVRNSHKVIYQVETGEEAFVYRGHRFFIHGCEYDWRMTCALSGIAIKSGSGFLSRDLVIHEAREKLQEKWDVYLAKLKENIKQHRVMWS